ncbi:MAG: hypothetical protein HY986_15040 [Candidatus Melainabacteria bacterium]|nr:hypothetical protein [Candidatus Melainabacteria bacterium]
MNRARFNIASWPFKLGLKVVAAILCFGSGFAGPASAGGKGVVKIEQVTAAHGPATVYISDRGIQFHMPRKGLIYYCMAPDWRLVVFKKATNQGLVQLREQWKGNSINKEKIVVLKSRSVPIQFAGKSCRKINLEVAPLDSYASKSAAFFRSGGRSSATFKHMDLIESNSIKLGPEQLQLARYVYGMPDIEGVLLEENLLGADGSKFNVIKTKSIGETASANISWKYPQGFKPASWSELLEQQKDLEAAADILGTLYEDDVDDKKTSPAKTGRGKPKQ